MQCKQLETFAKVLLSQPQNRIRELANAALIGELDKLLNSFLILCSCHRLAMVREETSQGGIKCLPEVDCGGFLSWMEKLNP